MLVGSTYGDDDYGKIRVVDATGTYIHVADNDHVLWHDNAYISVLNHHELYPIYASIEDYVDVDEDLIMYPDGDRVYTNQNTVLGTIINMGSHYAGFNTDTVFYTATGTYNVKGDTLAYYWTFEGGNPATATGMIPGNVTYATPGHYTTTLRVTNSSGGSDRSYRHISIYDRFANKPIDDWGMSELQGSRSEGGYSMTIWTRQADVSWVVDGALVVIFSEDVYGDTAGSIGGNSEGRNSVLFVGYIIGNSIKYDAKTSNITFSVRSITGLMKLTDGLSTSFDSVTSATKWQQITNMDLAKALYVYYGNYSTLLQMTDIKYKGSMLPVEYFETDQTNLYDSVNSYLTNKIVGQMISDRQGLIWIENGIEIANNATGVYPVNMSIQKQDWVDEPEINRKCLASTSLLDMAGFTYTGPATGVSTPFMAQAPGDVKNYYGIPQQGEAGLLLTGQGDLNQKVGDNYAYLNAEYPEIFMKMSSSFRNLDIAPIEQVLLTIHEEDTNQGIIFTEKPFHITSLNMGFVADSSMLFTNVTLHEITHGVTGDTVPVPQPPDDNYAETPELVYPEYEFPIFPDLIYPTPGGTNPTPLMPDCMGEVTPTVNGPYELAALQGTYYSVDDYVKNIKFPCWIRPSTLPSALRTYVRIEGEFSTRSISGSSLGDWTVTNGTDWYHVYGLDSNGNRIATATNLPVVAGVRFASFDSTPTGTSIDRVEFAIDGDSLAGVHHFNTYEFPSGAYNVYRNLSWGFMNAAKTRIWLKFSGARYTSSAATAQQARISFLAADSADNEYKWKNMFFTSDVSNMYISIPANTGCDGFINNSRIGYSGPNMTTDLQWISMTDDTYVRLSHTLWYLPIIKFTGQSRNSGGDNRGVGAMFEWGFDINSSPLGPCYGKDFTFYATMDAIISLEASKKAEITKFTMYNICLPTTGVFINDRFVDPKARIQSPHGGIIAFPT
jgi:hypothetical protein